MSTKKKLESLQVAGREASKQLESLEDKFQAFATDTCKKIEAVQSDLQQVVTQLAESVDTQQQISGSLTTFQTNTTLQFDQIGDHLVTTGENVSSLANSMTDIRSELARLFGLMAQDLASRNMSQATKNQTADEMTNMQVMPNNREVLSLPRRVGMAYDKPNAHEEGPLRSPPPKRTREGATLHYDDRPPEEMNVDHTEEMSVGVDMMFEDGDDITVKSHDTTESDLYSQDEHVCTDLGDRFAAATAPVEVVCEASTPGSVTASEAATPRHTNVNPLPTTRNSNTHLPRNTPAPLDSQYTYDMGPAGAADS
jgi:hypothetical protein